MLFLLTGLRQKKKLSFKYMVNSDKIKKIFGDNIKKLRKAKGLTQEQLAEALNLQLQSISYIENGRTFVSSEVLTNLSNFFNVEVSFFFKSAYIEHTDKELNLKKEINRLLSDCNHELLEKIYNIIITLKK